MTSTTSTTPALLAELLNGAEDGAALFFDGSYTPIPDDFLYLGTTTDGVRARFITGGSGVSERATFIPDGDRPLTDEELDAVLEAGGFKPAPKAGRLLEHFNELEVGQLIRVERKPLDVFRSMESGSVHRVSFVGTRGAFSVEDSAGRKIWDRYAVYVLEEAPGALTGQELAQAHYANGYDDGYNEGVRDGHDEGLVDGHNEGVKDGYSKGVKNGYDEGVKGGYNEGFADGYNEGFADGWVAFKRALLVADEVFDFWDDEKETAIESEIRVIEKAHAMRRVYWDTLGSPRTSQPQEASLRAWMEAFAEAEEA